MLIRRITATASFNLLLIVVDVLSAQAQTPHVHVAVSSPLAGRQVVGGTCVDWEVSAWVDRLGDQGPAVISVDLGQSSPNDALMFRDVGGPGATVDLLPGRRAIVLRSLARSAAGFYDFLVQNTAARLRALSTMRCCRPGVCEMWRHATPRSVLRHARGRQMTFIAVVRTLILQSAVYWRLDDHE